jgi:hypothetical protein
MEYSKSDIESLAAKLADAGLTDSEWDVMAALVGAAGDDVAGFGLELKIGFGALLPPHKNIVAQSGSGEIFRTNDAGRTQNRDGSFFGTKDGIVVQAGDSEI